MRYGTLFVCALMSVRLFADVEIKVANPVHLARESETISCRLAEIIKADPTFDLENITMLSASNEILLSQCIDNDSDGTIDEIVFQSSFKPSEVKTFIATSRQAKKTLKSPISTFGRYVPERSDDFAWENDMIAFRMYGPALWDNAVNSGVDCWLKRVPYPIIDKWYGQMGEKGYHTDWGEGHDPYHVGSTAGCGGLSIWEKGNRLHSNVYDGGKVIANGPVRTIFELRYDKSWKASGKNIKEVKRVTIDLGQRFCRFDSVFSGEGSAEIGELAIGITTHDNKAATHSDLGKGYMYCSEQFDGSYLGTAAFTTSEVGRFIEVKTKEKDQSHIFLITKPGKPQLTYYLGYGWEKAGVIASEQLWEEYIGGYIEKINNPLVVEYK